MTTLAIDIGNTRTKMAAFQQDKMLWHRHVATEALEAAVADELGDLCEGEGDLYVAWVSVAAEMSLADWKIWEDVEANCHFLRIHSLGNFLPIENRYATPATLGIDRLVSVIGARELVGNDKPVLVIDAGTAITYDFANAEGAYVGGGISPGMRMRFRALHEFTARLPLVSAQKDVPLVGNSTQSCMQSGVVNGVKAELQQKIHWYRAMAGEDLQIFLTGGDAEFFENQLEKWNFVDYYLVLRGIRAVVKRVYH